MMTRETMYQAIIDKDVKFEGVFFTAVKSTGIFCRPSCTARKPKIENVEFLETANEALKKGYRPCKVCNPLEKLGETPTFIKRIIEELNENPSLRFRESDLISRGIQPVTIRRWFLKNHGITFNAYQRMFRINSAFKKIQKGEAVTIAAFEAGYKSLSGFNDLFKNVFGAPPSQSRDKNVIDLTRIETQLGTMIACAVDQGICLLEFTDRKMLETELKSLAKTLKAKIIPGNNRHFSMLTQQLNEYFEGSRKKFTVPLFMPGTKFQQKVWHALQQLPFGETRSYKQQAIDIGSPDAIRAVANANGMNRIALLVPCHRVIGENGAMTGYGGGIWRKQWLLQHEKIS